MWYELNSQKFLYEKEHFELFEFLFLPIFFFAKSLFAYLLNSSYKLLLKTSEFEEIKHQNNDTNIQNKKKVNYIKQFII